MAGMLTVPIGVDSAVRFATKDKYDGARGCVPQDGYNDIHRGAQVTITDASGKVIGLTELKGGTLWTKGAKVYGDTHCEFDFDAVVPGGQSFYGVEVAHRGVVRYRASDLSERLHLTLGD